MSLWWGTPDNITLRLRVEVEAMRRAFGETFRLIVPAQGGLIYWIGTVELNLKGLSQRNHKLKILYPGDYPNRPAEAYTIEPVIRSDIYQYKDGRLSLFNPKDGPRYGWNPVTSTAVTLTAWAIQWLYAYYTAQALGKWPEPEGIDG